MTPEPWSLELAAPRAAPLLAIAFVWPFALGLLALVHYGPDAPPLGFSLLIVLSFPIVITYYGLKSAFLGSGRVRIDRDGFSVSRGFHEERHVWADVERFYVDQFGADEGLEGRPVPHFVLSNGSVHWLPGNLGLDAAHFVRLMMRLQALAARGWPWLPSSVADALRADASPADESRAAPHDPAP